jgi:hypothetical protein
MRERRTYRYSYEVKYVRESRYRKRASWKAGWQDCCWELPSWRHRREVSAMFQHSPVIPKRKQGLHRQRERLKAREESAP